MCWYIYVHGIYGHDCACTLLVIYMHMNECAHVHVYTVLMHVCTCTCTYSLLCTRYPHEAQQKQYLHVRTYVHACVHVLAFATGR